MGISGWLETFGVVFFALDKLRLLHATPVGAALPDAGAPVEVSLEAPVGRLVAHRPWLVPVFARHGMGQVSNTIFQRTAGKRVTLEHGASALAWSPRASWQNCVRRTGSGKRRPYRPSPVPALRPGRA
jgi:hypothetical protein